MSAEAQLNSIESNDFVDSDRPQSLLKGFAELYRNKQFVDITLIVASAQYPCHKNVLAISSPYFMAMFSNDCTESRSNVVTIVDVTPVTIELILDYIYTGRVAMSEETVQHLLSAANLFQLVELRTGCANFMIKHVTVANCIGIYFFSKAHQCLVLADKAKQIINSQFLSLCKEQEFLGLTSDKLIEIVSDSRVRVAREEDIFESCLAWLRHESDARQQCVEDVMACVRFANISSYYFCDQVDNNEMFESSPMLKKRLGSVRYYHMLKNRGHEMDLNLMPREGMSFKQAVMILANPYSEENKKRYNTMEALLPHTGAVTTICKLPNSLYMPGCSVTGDNQIFLAGGAIRAINYRGCITTEGISPNVYTFDIVSSTWNHKARLLQARYQFCLVVVDAYIYAVGGQDDKQIFGSVEKYDLATNVWTPSASMPKAVKCHSAISFKGRLYTFGGETATEIVKSVFCYEPITDQWTNLPDMTSPRALNSSVVLQNKIYVLGGNSAVSDKWKGDFLPEHCITSVEIYHPETNCWSVGPELPNALCGAGVVKYDGSILVVGGEDENSWMAGLFVLNQGGNEPTWIEGQELPTVMSTFGCVVANMPSDLFSSPP